jgi:uncharacterized protein YaaW (UPF0174 family)
MNANSSLSDLLLVAEVEDLDVLADYLTDKGEGRLMLDGDICRHIVRCKENGDYDSASRSLIANEIRAFGGNTLVNLFRGGGVEYAELARDVADHLKVPADKSSSVMAIEMVILQKLFTEALERMTPEERKKVLEELDIGDLAGMGPGAVAVALAASRFAGIAAYKMALIVANAIARAVLGRGLPLVVNAALTRTMGIMLGPVGWVLTGVWTMADLASPAYRVTVPCVVQIAYMRQKAILASTTAPCPNCSTVNGKGAKFCSECGTSLT